jgi:ferredoxin--NADP+ reductase/benzoyl-CoA 2,3-dioxygenase component A
MNAPQSPPCAASIEEQLGWDELPVQNPSVSSISGPVGSLAENVAAGETSGGLDIDAVRGSTVPPWSAAKPYVNIYTHKSPTTATIVGNYRLTDESTESDIHHIVLDFGNLPFPVLEGQSIGILPPGTTADGKPHHARQYSVFYCASASVSK